MENNKDGAFRFEDLKVGEYYVIAKPIIKFEPIYKDSEGNCCVEQRF